MRNVFIATGVIAAVSWGLMLRPWNSDRPVVSAETQEEKEQPPDLQTLAERAFLRGEYDRAIELYRSVVYQQPENAQAWARFAHAMHETEQFEPAIELHEKAATFDRNRITSSFRLACALARLGKVDEAITKLEHAVEVGYRDRTRAERDPDLATLRDDPRFLRVLNRMAPPPEGEGPIDFWQGHWVLRDSTTGEPTGHWSLNRVERGHLFLEQWHLYDGVTGRGMLHFDPTDGQWSLLRVDNQGQVQRLRGSADDGALTFAGTIVFPSGKTASLELLVRPDADRGVHQTSRISEDNGSSWSPFSDLKMNRDEPMWGGRGGFR